jgi:hypothetical protein
LEVRKQYQIEISNSFTALWNLSDTGDIKRAGENFRENIKITAYESLVLHGQKQNKPWFDEQGSQF